MFNLDDQTWRNQPVVMSYEILASFFDKLGNYLRDSELASFHVVLHGGEPLLAGKEVFRAIGEFKSQVESRTGKNIVLSMQTNGLLLNEEWVKLLYSLDIAFGISLDGPADYHDAFRKDFAAKGTHKDVESKVRWLLNHPLGKQVFASTLCVIHPQMDGRRLIRYFYELGVRRCDLLLPDQNHSYESSHYAKPDAAAKYGKLLAEAYKEWRLIDEPGFSVRTFDLLVRTVIGVTPDLDALGTGPIRIITIETSGEIEPVDTFKCCGDSYTKTGCFIQSAELEEASLLPQIAIGLMKANSFCEPCLSCDYLKMCGGGYMPHRFKDGTFSSPTVYCEDMKVLCSTVVNDVLEQIAPARTMSA